VGAVTAALRLGARTSPLARAQVELVGAALTARGVPWTFVGVTTQGDVDRRHLAEIGGTGLFVGAVREALRVGSIDVAVHSLKDLPTGAEVDLQVTAVPTREDTRDVLIGRRLADLGDGVRVGTGSPRRAMQLHDWAARTGTTLEVVPIRGNVDTRIGKVTSGELDAVVVAAAGLRRLGRVEEATELLDPLQMLPAPAQGALAIECRAPATAADEELAAALRSVLDDEYTRTAVTAERTLLAALEAGCSAPVGALADVVSDLDDHGRAIDRISLRAVLGTDDGALLRASATSDIDHAEKLGLALAAELLDLADPAATHRNAGSPAAEMRVPR
jgi:hydroxymethylbilane synthase